MHSLQSVEQLIHLCFKSLLIFTVEISCYVRTDKYVFVFLLTIQDSFLLTRRQLNV